MLTRTEFTHKFMHGLEMTREQCGLSQQRFSDLIGMSLSAYKRLLTSETIKIDLYSAYLIYKSFGIHLSEFIPEEMSQVDRILSMLKYLSKSQLDFIEAVVEFETKYRPDSQAIEDDSIDVLVLTGDMEDGMIYDTAAIEKIHIGMYRRLFSDSVLCGIRVTSNHLHPAYNNGDIVLISREPVRDGDIGVFINRSTNRAYMRKFHQTAPCSLEPINGYGRTFYVDPNDKSDMDNWIKFGRVLTKMRT